ncbi:MAG: thioredoxin domain-containing protein [Gammaproteobacteria bacterium]|nr:thioredoxin domain-containing protein [Gammaproteobacteria bacterium]
MGADANRSGATSRNRLGEETSPYLLQHADNPVHWQPWDAQALDAARDTGKPILLSIGYSACHWCHVMAHESFEHEDTAELMNELFVNIKVDREERPDLDHVYQTAHRILAQRPGGWPLTVFLSPEDQTPFFAGTYFPRQPRFGMPGFADILQRIHQAWTNQHEQLIKQNRELKRVFASLSPEPVAGDVSLDDTLVNQARRQLETDFDTEFGGFGGAPKFPRPSSIEFLQRHARARGDVPAQRFTGFALERMAEGGIYDQLGGGFYRYSVDQRWEIPHFEKMLYDNGLLLGLYSDAWLDTGSPLFRRVVAETAGWLIRDMQAPDGGYFSSLDADSEGREGAYYVWSEAEIDDALEDRQATLAKRHFGLDGEPNFEGEWHLNLRRSAATIAKEDNSDEATIVQELDAARSRLRRRREARIAPDRDDKILTSWNALAITGMARAGRAFNEPAWIDSAHCALDFVRDMLWQDGRLLACYKDGRSRFPAYLDDYAGLGFALLELLKARWSNEDLRFAVELADALLEHFEDREAGGFFFTADDHEDLIHRPKPFTDEATPSGNGMACRFLLQLGYLLAEPRYLDAAERTLRAGWESMKRMPAAHCAMLEGLRDYTNPPPMVVLRGEPDSMHDWTRKLASKAPRAMAFPIPARSDSLHPALAGKEASGTTTAYVCRGLQCTAAITSLDALIEELLG